MRRINLRRSAALVLAAVTILGSVVVPQTTTQAAGKKTVYLVTEEQSNAGGKTKYTYNGKGLLTKAAYTNATKSKETESKTVSTTKYSYNKKNRISAVKYDSTNTEIDYYTDNYGDRRPRLKDGKTSTTTVTKKNAEVAYTYDKKGKVTQTVETAYGVSLPENTSDTSSYDGTIDIPTRFQETAQGTYVKSEYGSRYRVSKPASDSNGYSSDYVYVYLKDNSDDRGYSYYKGDYYIDATKLDLTTLEDDEKKLVNDALAAEKKYSIVPGTGVDNVKYTDTTTTTTTYTDNGNGSLTKTTTVEEQNVDRDNSTAISVVYTKNSTVTTITTTVKNEITTSYTYDKKKRVKKAVADTVRTTTTTGKRTYTSMVGTPEQKSTDSEFTRTATKKSRITDSYTYNKKGKATKIVTLNEPDIRSEEVINKKYPDSVQKYENGEYKTVTETRESTQSIVIENGTKTRTNADPKKNDDGSVTTVTTTKSVAYPANVEKYTTTFKYDKKGNIKSYKGKNEDTNNRAATYTVVDGVEKQVYNQKTEKQYDYATNTSKDVQVDDYESPVYTTKTTTSTSTYSKDVELKKNTARLTKVVGMDKWLPEGASTSSYDVSRTTYKVKSKKVARSTSSAANKQQWIIQNGMNNGETGLNVRDYFNCPVVENNNSDFNSYFNNYYDYY